MTPEEAILRTIAMLACDGFFILTDHATDQRINRGMSTADVEDVLCNPTRLIRTDVEDGVEKHKIEGGSKKQRLAVTITNDKLIVVITAMD
jgi:uncharacterized DUF497 family protein